MNKKIFIYTLFLFLFVGTNVFAGSPNYIDENGTGAFYRWKNGKVNVYFDAGPLINMSNSTAVISVVDAWREWETAYLYGSTINDKLYVNKDPGSIDFIPGEGLLSDGTPGEIYEKGGIDIDVNNYTDYICGDQAYDSNRNTVIIFDYNGEILEKMVEIGCIETDDVYGITELFAFDKDNMNILTGTILINGKLFNTTGGADKFVPTLIHELGHLMNLDHSAVNHECFSDPNCAGVEDGWQYLPSMYRYALADAGQETLSEDDIAWSSYLYNYKNPNSLLMSKFCTVRGKVYDVDQRGFQGAQMIVRDQNDQLSYAISAITGSVYPACTIDNPSENIYPGEYVITGLRPGKTYAVEYGPIPDFCADQDYCGLASGINPYAPPRQLEEGFAKTGGSYDFVCQEGGQVIEADPVILAADLDKSAYREYSFDGYDFTCTPGVGMEIEETPDDSENEGEGAEKKGWCSLIPGSSSGFAPIFFLIPAILIALLRRKRSF